MELSLFLITILLTVLQQVVPSVTALGFPATASGVTSCCQALQASFNDRVVIPGSPAYFAAETSYWSQQEAQVTPACYVQPITSGEVLGICNVLVSRQYNCSFAVRGGGHSPFAGFANINGGVTIDLSRLRSLILSPDKKSITVGAGNTWIDVYQLLDREGLSVTGGRASSVGVSGLILGGGLSFFAARYGIDCDNVINFEIVTGPDQLLQANSLTNPDLFKALKGGSSNLGILTSVTLETFPQGNFWGGFYGILSTYRTQALSFFSTFTANSNYDPYASLIMSFSWSATAGLVIFSNVEYTADNPPQSYPPTFKALTDIPSIVNTMRFSNLSDFVIELDGYSPAGKRERFATGTYKVDYNLLQYAVAQANATVLTLTKVSGLVFSLSLQPLPTELLSKSGQNGGNILGLSAASGPLFNALVTASWTNAADDSRMDAALRSFFQAVNNYADLNHLRHPYLYLNYAANWQSPIESYGRQNADLLKSVSRKYDPDRVFQKRVPGGFKVGI